MIPPRHPVAAQVGKHPTTRTPIDTNATRRMKATSSSAHRSIVMISFVLAAVVLGLYQQVASASGLFELNLSALTDSYGRDLRLDCCAWQNATNQQAPSGVIAAGQQAQAEQPCDPTKCQLIIRICVKNYQTKIDASQCTFGELSAQVIKPYEAAAYHGYLLPAGGATGSGAPTSFQRLQQQQQLATISKRWLSPSSPANIHYQRLLMQQLQLQNQLQPQQAVQASTNEQHSRLYHQMPQILASGQPRAMRTIAFDQPISFPFNFTWPGAFALVVDAWYESPTGRLAAAPQTIVASPLVVSGSGAASPFGLIGGTTRTLGNIYQQQQQQQALHQHQHQHRHQHHHHNQQQQQPTTTYDLYKRQLIMQHSMHGWLEVKNEWTSGMHRTDSATLAYSYRVTCQPNYYGEQCSILCKPRDDIYGHSTCSQQGEIVCMPGWQGKYCEEPICLPGCSKDQGNCTRPNECHCRLGWQGPSCEQCSRFPGCVHGYCNKPHECICEEGWGGLLCNQDLDYCTNHQPCKNGACTKRLDSSGDSAYTCQCDDGFMGKNCDRRIVAYLNGTELSGVGANKTPHQLSAVSQQHAMISNSSSQQQPQAARSATTSGKQAASSQQKQAQPQHSRQDAFPLSAHIGAAAAGTSSVQMGATTVQQLTGSSLDHRVMIAYGIIIVCMVVLVVLLLLRVFFERLSGAVVGCSQPLDGHRHRHHARRRSSHRSRHNSSSRYGTTRHSGDAATIQNHENFYKSRTSLSTDKVPFSDALDGGCATSDTCSTAGSSSDDGLHNDSLHHHRDLMGTGSSLSHLSRHHLDRFGQIQQQQQQQYGQHPALGPLSAHHHLLGTAHSVHNLNAANASRQPPPPPYAAVVTSRSQPMYAGASSMTYGGIYAPPVHHPIYTNNSIYKSGSTVYGRHSNSVATTLNHPSRGSSRTSVSQSSKRQSSDSATTNKQADNSSRASGETENSQPIDTNSNSDDAPGRNHQNGAKAPAPQTGSGSTSHGDGVAPAASSNDPMAPGGGPGTNASYQSPYYVIYHIL